jgi:hypothetical protein
MKNSYFKQSICSGSKRNNFNEINDSLQILNQQELDPIKHWVDNENTIDTSTNICPKWDCCPGHCAKWDSCYGHCPKW